MGVDTPDLAEDFRIRGFLQPDSGKLGHGAAWQHLVYPVNVAACSVHAVLNSSDSCLVSLLLNPTSCVDSV